MAIFENKKIVYPRIPHDKWKGVKIKESLKKEILKMYELGMKRSDIAKTKIMIEYGGTYSTRWQAVDRVVEPEKYHLRHKEKWEKEKNNPVLMDRMRERRRRNELLNKNLYPEKRKYHKEYMREFSKTPQEKERARQWELANKEKRKAQAKERYYKNKIK